MENERLHAEVLVRLEDVQARGPYLEAVADALRMPPGWPMPSAVDVVVTR